MIAWMRAAVVLAALIVPVRLAAAPAEIAGFAATLHLQETIEVMRDEGLVYGASLEAELFPDGAGADWHRKLAQIYDPEAMRAGVEDALAADLSPEDRAEIADFMGSELGQRILTLELGARRSLMDEAVSRAADLKLERMILLEDPRLDQVLEFIEVNDLVEANVQGGLNANLAFYRTLAESGALGQEMSEAQILSDVWAEEPAIREETQAWLLHYLAMAYEPLSDAEFDRYLEFSRSAAGQRMNRALFRAFDAMFVRLSRDLGRITAERLLSRDL